MLERVERRSPRRPAHWDRGELKFQWEPFRDVANEVLPLVRRHFEATGLEGRLNPDWAGMFWLANLGRFVVVTARNEEGRLVGYCTGLLVTMWMNMDEAVLMVNNIYLEPTYRYGLAAKRFLDMMEEFGREKGCARLEMAPMGKYRHGIARLLKYLGWGPSPDPCMHKEL